MKLFFLSCTLLISVLTAEESQGFYQVEDQTTFKIKTPSLSSRKTSKICLDNGLSIYLVSDPKADQSAAALSMHTGSWSDNPQYPGIAHFLEHLLFLGSETYPEENAYDKQIWDNGGMLNAYTAPDRTVYMFSVNNNAFTTTLDMFSHMFIDPLFNPSGITRELHAVDQEHDKNIESDSNRLWMVLKETGNDKHPNALFSTGNSNTLGGIPPEEVKKWYQTNYSSDKAHLALYSSLSIEELQALSVRYFSDMPKSSTFTPKIDQKLLSSNQEGHIIGINPIKDLRRLSICWELPKKDILDIENKSYEFISYIIGGKQKSSLYAQLKKEKLVEDLSAGLGKISKDCGLFVIDFDLTPQGVIQLETVIERSFQTINSLKQSGVPPYIFNETIMMSKIDYEYQSRMDPFQFVTKYANDMIDESLASFPEKTLIPTHFDPNETQSFLSRLTPEKASYFLLAPKDLTQIVPENTEQWSGAEYGIRKIPNEQLIKWNKIEQHPNIRLPKANPFIPRNLELTTILQEENTAVTPIPILLSDNEQGKVYFWKDSQYHVPEIAWIFNIRSPLLDGSSKSSVMLDLFNFALEEKLSDTLSYAKAASLNTKFYTNNLIYTCAMTGYSEKAPLLLKSILKEIKHIKITKEEFDLYSTSLMSNYSNMGQSIPLLQAQEIMKSVVNNISPKHNEQIAALNNISYEDFSAFGDKLFQESYIEAILTGNMEEKDANKIWNMVQKKLNYTPYPLSDHEKKQMLILSPIQGPYKIHETTRSLGNAAILAIQEGPFSFHKKASSSVLGIALQEDFFDTLRTKQQTGYIAKAYAVEEEQQLFNYFLVQSTTHQPDELIARFELFLETYVKDFESMITEGRFEMIRDSLIANLTTPPTNLPKMANYLNTLAFNYKGDFERLEKLIQALKELSYEELKIDTKNFLSRKNSKRIAVMLEGKQPEEKSFCYEGVTAETLKNEGTYISLP